MAVEQERPIREQAHRLVLEEGKRLTATGITEVLRVDPESVVLRAGSRILVVRGEGLALKQLTPSDGVVEIRGQTDSLSYEQAGRSGLLRRLFG